MGPIAGSILAVIIFKIIKVLEYETANPDPEAAAPTGPVTSVDQLEQPTSHTEDRDLERGDSKERYDSTQDTNSFLRNTGSNTAPTNGIVKPTTYPTEGVNGVNSNQPYGDAGQAYRVHDYQHTQYAPTNERTLDTTQAQYSTQPQGQAVTSDDRRWNTVHTANARANTTVVHDGTLR